MTEFEVNNVKYQLVRIEYATGAILPKMEDSLQSYHSTKGWESEYLFDNIDEAKNFVRRFREYNGLIRVTTIDVGE